MIKSLLGDDEITKTGSEDKHDTAKKAGSSEPVSDLANTLDAAAKETSKPKPQRFAHETVKPFEIVEPIGKPRETIVQPEVDASPKVDEVTASVEAEVEEGVSKPTENKIVSTLIDPPEAAPATKDKFDSGQINILPKTYTPEEPAESARKSGLAFSAAIVLFGSVVFTMLLGWFADLTFGTQPWGIVGGIILGAVIGFVQFFRTTAQILRPPKDQIKEYPLFSNQDDDNID